MTFRPPITLLAILLGAYTCLGQITNTLPASSIPSSHQLSNLAMWRASPIDWSSTEWNLTESTTNSMTGKIEEVSRRYIEVADGLNYLDSAGAWKRSSDEIELLTNPFAGAAAMRGPMKVYFSSSLGGEDSGITLISASNTVVKISPLAVYYVDDSTGKSVLLASVKPEVEGELIGSNQVIYRGALDGDLEGDLRFKYQKGRCESDLIILCQPASPPEAYGLNPDSVRLEMVSLVTAPIPRVSFGGLAGDLPDMNLEYDSGRFRFGKGCAFSFANDFRDDERPISSVAASADVHNQQRLPVAKNLIQVGNAGQWGLGESLRWVDIKPWLQALPPCQQGDGSLSRPQRHASSQRQWPTPVTRTPRPSAPMKLASVAYQPRGLVLDWTILSSGAGYCFSNGVTYHISDFCSFTSDVTFSPGCTLKFTPGACLWLTGPVSCTGCTTNPSVLTSIDDWTVGETVPGGTGSPGYSADPALRLGQASSPRPLAALRIRWAKTAIYLDGQPEAPINYGLRDSSLESCWQGIFCNGSGIALSNSTRCQVEQPLSGSGGWAYTGDLTDVCGGSDQTSLAGVSPGPPSGSEVSLLQSAPANVDPEKNNNPLALTCVAPPPGLVAWWRGEGDATDAVGGNDGKYCGSSPAFASGQVGQGYYVNPSGLGAQYVLVPSSPALKPTGEFTVELWYKDTGSKSYWVGLIGKMTPAYTGYYIHLLAGSTLGVVFGDPANGTHSLSIAAPSANAFHHVAATWRQSDPSHVQMKLFVDGACLNTGTYSGNLTNIVSDTPLRIGTDFPTGDFFTGIIDEVSFYSRALTTNEVVSVFDAGAAGKCVSTYAPAMSVQPTNQTVSAGSDVLMAALASGSPKLSYQWLLGVNAISGATNRYYITNNVRVGQNGNYSVVITNAYGSVTSSIASLSITSAPSCVVPPSGLVAWWKAETNAVDQVGGNSGALINGTTYGPGKAGQAFSFLGYPYGSAVNIPSSPTLRLTNELTYEFWYKGPLAGVGGNYGLLNKYPIPERCGCTTVGANYGALTTGDDYYMSLYLSDTNYGMQGLAYWPPPTPGMFHHLAVSYHQSTATSVLMTMYLDGQPVLTNSVSGNLANALSDTPVTVGAWWPDGHASFQGIIDEAAIYSRSLSAAEVASIYAAGSGGKCVTTNAPQIVLQPTNQTANLGDEVALSVFATGTPNLSFQWQFNGSSIAGATNSSYLLNDVQSSGTGTYSVIVTNIAGGVTSSPVSLSVTSPRACLSPPSGLISWWRAEGDATDCVGTNNGSPVNGAGFASGKVNSGFSFAGSNYVQIPGSATLRLTNAFTVQFWYKNTGSSGTHGLVSKLQSTFPYTANFGIWEVPNDDLIAGYLDPNLGYWNVVEFSPVPTIGLFHHVAAVYQQIDASHVQINLYVDGQCGATGTYSGNLANAVSDSIPVTVGAFGTANCLTGVVDELAIFSRALSSSEIQGIYASSASGFCLTGDHDGDGLPDSWEQQYFGSLRQLPGGDPDGDGLSNLQEYLLGTNPTNNDLGLKVLITNPKPSSALP